MGEYNEFLEKKVIEFESHGFDFDGELNPKLFDFQADIVRWALKKGKSACFAECGLGKTAIALEWAHRVVEHTSGKVLILAPLAVSYQTIKEAVKFGIPAKLVESQDGVEFPGIYITNYEKLEHFKPELYNGIVLDESSCLKAWNSKTRQRLVEVFKATPFKLCCTATPSPNDHMEILNHASFLNVMDSHEALAIWFINDTMKNGTYRLKHHAVKDFWRWVSSWAISLSNPTDLGYSDQGFTLPPLNVNIHNVSVDISVNREAGELFRNPEMSATSYHREKRLSLGNRLKKVIELVENSINKSKNLGLNIQYEQGKEKSIQQGVLLEGRGESAQAGDGLVFPEQGQDRQDEKERISPQLLFNAQGKIRDKQRKERREELSAEEEICGKCGIQGEGEEKGQRIPPKYESFSEESSKAKDLQFDDRSIQNDAGISGLQLRDMRNERERESKDFSSSGSRSRDGESEGLALRELQSGDREIQRKYKYDEKSHRIPQWAIWCDLNIEQDTLEKELKAHGFSVSSIYGRLSSAEKEKRILEWLEGETEILLSKASVCGFGLNLQVCHNVIFSGLSYSYESYYQATRRFWRFGQEHPVNLHVILSKTEKSILDTIMRKENDYRELKSNMQKQMNEFNSLKRERKYTMTYESESARGDNWELILGDSIEEVKKVKDESIDFTVFSPPFSNVYIYSDSYRDMGNNKNDAEFFKHFEYLIPELFRITVTGRLCAVHCKQLVKYQNRDLRAGLKDFRGDIIRAFEKHGWQYHSEVTIWKDPVIEMQRTKSHGLLYKQLRKDSSYSRQGIPDYLVIFRKWEIGDQDPPKPINHWNEKRDQLARENGLESGADLYDSSVTDEILNIWQRYASPVWFDIQQTNVLNACRELEDDERHICPLQLGVVERAVDLWSNPGDLVFSPFAGIGSEGYQSLKMGRRFLGIELKREYYQRAIKFFESLEVEKKQLRLL